MLLAQDSAPGLGLWSLGLSALWSAALLAQSGEDRFGDRRIVLAHAGSIIPSTGIAGITTVDGIIIKAHSSPRLLTKAAMTSRRFPPPWTLLALRTPIRSYAVFGADPSCRFRTKLVRRGDGNGKIGRQAAYLPGRCLRDGVGGRNGNSRLLAAQFSAPKLIAKLPELLRRHKTWGVH